MTTPEPPPRPARTCTTLGRTWLAAASVEPAEALPLAGTRSWTIVTGGLRAAVQGHHNPGAERPTGENGRGEHSRELRPRSAPHGRRRDRRSVRWLCSPRASFVVGVHSLSTAATPPNDHADNACSRGATPSAITPGTSVANRWADGSTEIQQSFRQAYGESDTADDISDILTGL
jgi:hypothetical protein